NEHRRIASHRRANRKQVANTKLSERSRNNVIDRDRRRPAPPDSISKGPPFALMPFVLTETRAYHLLAAVTHQFQAPEIVQHRHGAAAKYFHALLGKTSIATGEVGNDSL